MTNDAEAADGGPLSVDQAAELLGRRAESEPVDDDEAAIAEALNDEDDPDADDASPEPPQFWDAEAKARFRELSPEHQALVLAQAEKGVKASARAIQEAAERAKSAEAEARGVNALAAELSTFLPQAVQTFQSRWDAVDWVQLSQTDASEYVRLKAMHEAEQGELRRLSQVQQSAEHESRQAFVRQERAALPTHAPALADPEQGEARRRQLGAWLKDQGATDEDLNHLSAIAAGIAYDAMLYHRAKAGLAPRAVSKPGPARLTTPTAPAARTPKREVEAAARRLSQTGRVEDAIALLQARRK